MATTRARLRSLLSCTLLAFAPDPQRPVDLKVLCDDALRTLIKSQAIEVSKTNKDSDGSHMSTGGNCVVYDDSELIVTKLGKAAIKGCMELSVAKQLLGDLETAAKSLVLMGSLHLLYLVTPHDAAGIKPDYRHYYSLYSNLDSEGLQTAKILGITESNSIRMVTGKPITSVSEIVLCRFYLALMLRDLWRLNPTAAVADKYSIPRGTVQAVMTSSASFALSAQRFCEELQPLWTFSSLFGGLASRLQHCAAPELQLLMELPAVKKSRALQLTRAGYKRIEDIAKASVSDLVSSVSHLSTTAATLLVSAARMMLIEKVENLRSEAEDVMAELT